MNEEGDLPIEDPLSTLLDSYVVAAGDIESQVMAQIAAEEDRNSLRTDVAALRADVAAMRSEMVEIKRILLARNSDTSARAIPRSSTIDDTRGDRLLPYAPRDATPMLLG